MQTFSYNREAAVSYAKMWALSRNPAYYDFSALGGDFSLSFLIFGELALAALFGALSGIIAVNVRR